MLWFEYQASEITWEANKRSGEIYDLYYFFDAMVFIIFLISGFLGAIWFLIFKRFFLTATIYLLISVLSLTKHYVTYNLSNFAVPIEMNINGHLLSKIPSLCGHKLVSNAPTVCYGYMISYWMSGRIDRETLVIDSTDEMSRPSTQWSDSTKRIFYGPQLPDGSIDECAFRKTTRIEGHVYWVSDDCSRKY